AADRREGQRRRPDQRRRDERAPRDDDVEVRAGRPGREHAEQDPEHADGHGAPRGPPYPAGDPPDAAGNADEPDEERYERRAGFDRRQREEEREDPEADA